MIGILIHTEAQRGEHDVVIRRYWRFTRARHRRTGQLRTDRAIPATRPGDLPRLHGVDVFGGTLALNGTIGGDHIIYVDFKQRFNLPARIEDAVARGRFDIAEQLRRCQRMAGILLIDVSGHCVTDALLAAMLHQAFLLGAIYELDMFGRITSRLFENLNARFYKSSQIRVWKTRVRLGPDVQRRHGRC